MTVEELSLFGGSSPMVRRDDPQTSRVAAKRVNQGSGQYRVLRALLRLERATDAEIRETRECSGMGFGSAAKRRKECVDAGWVRACGVRDGRLLWCLTVDGMGEAVRS